MTLRRAERTGRRLAALLTLLTLGFVSPSYGTAPPSDGSAPTADDPGSFAVQPSGTNGPGGRDYFVYTLKSGEVFGDVVGVSNLSTETKTYAIYATDALNTTDGGFTLLKEEDKPKDVGSWVEIGATQYTLDPGQRADIPFKLTVPADATPGDHVGAIVAQEIPDSTDSNDDGIGVNVRVRIGARIYLRVDGPLTPSLSVSRFAIDYDTPASPFASQAAKITYVVTNSGNIRLSPAAKLKISGLFGLDEKQLPDRAIPELLPGSSLEIAETVQDVQPLGRLTADLTLEAPADGVLVRSSVQIWTVPWLGVAVPLFVVLLLVGLFFFRRHRRLATTADVETEQ